MIAILKYPIVFLVALAVSLLLTPLLIRLAPVLKLVDKPGPRRLQKTAVPRCGGIGVFLATHAALAATFLIPWQIRSTGPEASWWFGFLLLSSMLLVVGLLDDRFELRPIVKLTGQVITASVAYALGLRVGEVLGAGLIPALDYLLTVLWIVVIVNAFNLIDGIDGLAAGLAAIGASGMALSFVLRRMPMGTLVCLALLGACIGFLRYNFHPARIFLGDSGSMFLGLFLALLPLATNSKTVAAATVGVPLLAVGVPVFDAALAVWRRLARRFTETSGSSKSGVFDADTDHVHHRLLRSGMTQSKAATMLYLLAGTMVLIGILAALFASKAHGIFLVAFVLGVYVVVSHLARTELDLTAAAATAGMRHPTSRILATIIHVPVDVIAFTISLTAAMLLTSPTHGFEAFKRALIGNTPTFVAVPFCILVLTGVYRQVWSRARILDYVMLTLRVFGATALACGITLLRVPLTSQIIEMSVLFGLFTILFLNASRILRRAFADVHMFHQYHSDEHHDNACVVYGADAYTDSLLQTLVRDAASSYYVVALCDEDQNLRGRIMFGLRVMGGLKALTPEWIKENGVKSLILSAPVASDDRRRIIDFAASHDLELLETTHEINPVTSYDAEAPSA